MLSDCYSPMHALLAALRPLNFLPSGYKETQVLSFLSPLRSELYQSVLLR